MILKANYKGSLIAIGGNEDKVSDLVVLKRTVQEITNEDYSVAVITTASEEPVQRGEDYRKVFSTLGATRIEILNISEKSQANDDAQVQALDDIDLIFLCGGDQLRLTTILLGSKVLRAVKDRLEAGAVIAGTSAGAAAFSEIMIYDGKSEEGLFKGGVLTASGFGFVKNIVFDTHFIERGRTARLIQIVTTNPSCIGVGIGEDSSVLLKGDGTLEVIGQGQVIIVDGSDITHSNIVNIKPGQSIAVENIKIHSLVHGYGYNFKSKSFLLPLPQKIKSEKIND
ncbi:MAG: cyanophycinase [Chlamydiales bacterium]|jgi:cyanophycinase